ncbi:hypothetical protein BGZ65_009202, partial [Modicella reniformis]
IMTLLSEVHAESLEEVIISSCDSKSVQKLLTSCRRLRYLEIRSEILIEDLLENVGEEIGGKRGGGEVVPWVCGDLEVLKVYFAQRTARVLYPTEASRVSPTPEGIAERALHQKLWTLIGKMVQLHVLHVYTLLLQEDYSPRCLLISNGGVESIVGLKNLKKLKLCGCQYHLIKDDVQLLQKLKPTLFQD